MIALGDLHRGQVVRGVKTAHLYPVSRKPAAEPPYAVGERHALYRVIPDPDERGPDGKYPNRNDDGTPKEPPPECHVVITSITEVPLLDLVAKDAKAIGYDRITEMQRWWLNERRPSWRSRHAAAEYVAAQVVHEEFRRLFATKTAWLVRWEIDRVLKTEYLPSAVGPRTTNTSPQMRSAGPAVPAGYVAKKAKERRKVDDARRRRAAEKDAKKARKLLEDVDALFKGEEVPAAEKRRHRSRHRKVMHFLEQDVRGIEERARA